MQHPASTVSLPIDPGLSSEFHRWPLPGYLWPALEKRSQSIFCTEPHLRLHGSLTPDIEAWVQRRDGCITGLWLFRRLGRRARVINEVVTINITEAEQFAEALFARYDELDAVELHAVHLVDGDPEEAAVDAASVYLPDERASARKQGECLWQRAIVSEDFVLDLPATVDDWHASLSVRSREKLRQCVRRAQRSDPALNFRLQHDADISERELRAVLQMSRARMRAKGRHYGMDAVEERRLCALMRERGQLATIEVDGHLRAGLLCTLAGNDVYMHVIAHDPAFDELRLGYLCCVLCIEAAIAQRRQHFHFLWGWYDYKVRLGGKRQTLEHALLWRSGLAACRHPWQVARQQWRSMKAALRERRAERQQAQTRTLSAADSMNPGSAAQKPPSYASCDTRHVH